MEKVVPHSLFTDHDIYLFKEGKHFKLYDKSTQLQNLR